MNGVSREPSFSFRKPSLPIIGCLILVSVVLGTTDVGYIAVPTIAGHVTTMHLPTIVASLVEGWPVGMVVGVIFGMTSIYMSGAAMMSDPLVALLPRILVGLTPYLCYVAMRGYHEYVRLALSAIVGSLTNTIGVLGLAYVFGYMEPLAALNVGMVHGLPESVVAGIVVVPAVVLLRKARSFFDNFGR